MTGGWHKIIDDEEDEDDDDDENQTKDKDEQVCEKKLIFFNRNGYNTIHLKEKKSLKEKMHQMQEITLLVQVIQWVWLSDGSWSKIFDPG